MDKPTEQVSASDQHDANKLIVSVFKWIAKEVENWDLLPEDFGFRNEGVDVINYYVQTISAQITSHKFPNREQKPVEISIRLRDASLEPKLSDLHERNKIFRDCLAWIHYGLQMKPGKMNKQDNIRQALGVLHTYCTQLQKDIELIEPPAPPKEMSEKKAPYVIDVPTLQADAIQ